MTGNTRRSSAGSRPWWIRRIVGSRVLRGCTLAVFVVMSVWVASDRAVLEGVMDFVAPCPTDQHHHMHLQLDDRGIQRPMIMCEFDEGRHPADALDERDRYTLGYGSFGKMMVEDSLRRAALGQGRAHDQPR